MDNFSVLASLVLFGLYLLISPSAGFVVDYIDLSDQMMQSSTLERQAEPKRNGQGSDFEEESGLIFGSPDNNQIPEQKPENSKNEYDPSQFDILSNEVAVDNQNGGSSHTESYKRDGGKIVSNDNEKDANNLLAEAQTHSDNDLVEHNTIVIQMTSRL